MGNLKTVALLFGSVALTGCDKLIKPLTQGHASTVVPAPVQNGSAPAVFILAGQSNMTGTGAAAGPFDGRINFVGGMDVGAVGNGPGLPFAASFLRTFPNAKITLVQCAVGGSPMSYWAPGGHLYRACIELAKTAPGTLAGVLFSQGEADAQLNNTDWDQNFISMVRSFRADLRAPGLPVIYTRLGTNAAGLAGWDEIKREQANAEGSLSGLAMVRTDDLTKVDQYHYDAASFAALGERMAGAYFAME